VEIFDIAVVGAGPAGLVAGLAAAAAGLKTAVVGPAAPHDDGRTAALLDGSVNLLKRLELWREIAPIAEPLKSIRLVDATGALLRAPEVLFQAAEIGLPVFGYNVPTAGLTAALDASSRSRLTRIVSKGVISFDLGSPIATLETAEGERLSALLVVAADGRGSAARSAAGISVSGWSYPQAAVVTTFAHTRPHFGISTELHRATGPLTVVPGPGKTSSLVWVETPAEAGRLAALPEDALAHDLNLHLQGLLGELSQFTPRRTYPLSIQRAAAFAKSRVALVGEAAHVIPPIGAQGLNLGFRDAAVLAEIAREASSRGEDIGGEAPLARYHSLRLADITSRTLAVDLLNRSLLSWIPGIHLARSIGLMALASSPTLRARVMREGVMPSADVPALMQPVPAEDVQGDTQPGALDERRLQRA
jgi:2-octaprenyl-6-methoxyphenol hydroxylase